MTIKYHGMIGAFVAITIYSTTLLAGQAHDVNVVNTPNVNVKQIPYAIWAQEEIRTDTQSMCYFDVPAGKIFKIERINGTTFRNAVKMLTLNFATNSDNSPLGVRLIPKVASVAYTIGGTTRTNNAFDAKGPIYARDSNGEVDTQGDLRDIRLIVELDGTGANDIVSGCTLIGQLLPSN